MIHNWDCPVAIQAAFRGLAEPIRRFGHDVAGSYIVTSALLMPVLIGLVGFGTDYGFYVYQRQHMQGAADAAAFSAATAMTFGTSDDTSTTTEARAAASSYGFKNGTKNAAVTVNQPPKSGTHMVAGAVEVIIKQPQPRFFSALMGSGSVMVAARAVAMSGSNGLGCVLSLDPSASGSTTVQGTANIALTGCSMFDNSNSSTAISVGGSSTVSAYSVGVVGGILGTSNITASHGIATGQSPIRDPYAGSSFGSFSGCDHTKMSVKDTETLSPGVYCNGLSLNAGANVILLPGIYYIDQGSLSVNGGATLSGDGVTIVFTSSTGSNYATATINGGATVNITAPTSGPTAGIAIFGDRNMPTGTTFKFNGGASQVFTGAIYVPKGAVQFAGGADTSRACTQLVADTVTFTGNANFAINCTGIGTKPIATAATMVE
jgi:Flp pilus assembly protein TadG